MSTKTFANILAAVNKMTEQTVSSAKDDENFWRAETDKAGNGFAIIRFLPAKSEDDLPFVKLFDHGFQGPNGKWFIEKCPTTIGQECPVCQANGPLWNSGRESDKEIVRKRKRRTSFIANVLVVSDPKNPDNEGKVFLFKFGRKIFDKIKDVMQPEFEDETPMNPFDIEEGANFKLKIRKVEGYANFDKSEFEASSAVDVEIMGKVFDLNPYVDPKAFKSFEALEAKFQQVTSGRPAAKPVEIEEDDIPFESPKPAAKKEESKPKPAAKKEEDDDDMSYFRSLADED